MSELRKTLPLEINAFLGECEGAFLYGDKSLNFSGEPSLEQFLASYSADRLYPVDLTAICKAYFLANRNEGRELIQFDREIRASMPEEAFSRASATVGKTHLLHLRPLRDNRLVQRYIASVEAGDASGWHSIVYGVSLWIYSVPLRQGLLAYSTSVLESLAWSAGRHLCLGETAIVSATNSVIASVPKQIDFLLAPDEGLFKAA